jgi:predicted ester cyclase
MAEKENKAIIHAFVAEVWNRKNVVAIDKYFAPDYLEHNLAAPDKTGGLEGTKQFIPRFISGFPDCKVTYDDVLAEGDRVAIRFTCRGTHKGEFMGVAPTGRQIYFMGLSIARFVKGKVAEMWEFLDTPGLMRQIGSQS